jgi:hypothetical protein
MNDERNMSTQREFWFHVVRILRYVARSQAIVTPFCPVRKTTNIYIYIVLINRVETIADFLLRIRNYEYINQCSIRLPSHMQAHTEFPQVTECHLGMRNH